MIWRACSSPVPVRFRAGSAKSVSEAGVYSIDRHAIGPYRLGARLEDVEDFDHRSDVRRRPSGVCGEIVLVVDDWMRLQLEDGVMVSIEVVEAGIATLDGLELIGLPIEDALLLLVSSGFAVEAGRLGMYHLANGVDFWADGGIVRSVGIGE